MSRKERQFSNISREIFEVNGETREVLLDQDKKNPDVIRRTENILEPVSGSGKKQLVESRIEDNGVLQERRTPVTHEAESGVQERAWITAVALEKYRYREDGSLKRVDISETQARRHVVKEHRVDRGDAEPAEGFRALRPDEMEAVTRRDGRPKETVTKTHVDNRFTILYDKNEQVECLKKTVYSKETNAKDEYRIFIDSRGDFRHFERKTTFYEPADSPAGKAEDPAEQDKDGRKVIHTTIVERELAADGKHFYHEGMDAYAVGKMVREAIGSNDLTVDHIEQMPEDAERKGKAGVIKTVNEYGEVIKIRSGALIDFYDRTDWRVRFEPTGPSAVEVFQDHRLAEVIREPAKVEAYVKDIAYYLSSSTDPVTQMNARKMITFRDTNVDLWGSRDEKAVFREQDIIYKADGRKDTAHVVDSRNGAYDKVYRPQLYVTADGKTKQKDVVDHVVVKTKSPQEESEYRIYADRYGDYAKVVKSTKYLDRDGAEVLRTTSVGTLDKSQYADKADIPSVKNDNIQEVIAKTRDPEKTYEDGTVDTRLVMGRDQEPVRVLYFDKEGYLEDSSSRRMDIELAKYEIEKQKEENIAGQAAEDPSNDMEEGQQQDTEAEPLLREMTDEEIAQCFEPDIEEQLRGLAQEDPDPPDPAAEDAQQDLVSEDNPGEDDPVEGEPPVNDWDDWEE